MKDKTHNMNSVIKNHNIEDHVMSLEPWLWNRSSEERIPWFSTLGTHFESPQHPRDKHLTQKLVKIAGNSSKCCCLAACLEQLQSEAVSSPSLVKEADHFDDELTYENYIDPADQDFILSNGEDHVYADAPLLPDEDLEAQHWVCKHSVLQDPTTEHLCNNWKVLIPTIIKPYLYYVSWTLGKPLSPVPLSITLCNQSQCICKSVNIVCLLFDHKWL